MYFSKKRLKDLDFSVEYPVIHQGGEFYRVCYSCHSSLEELLNFVNYFPHHKLIPIVIPQNCTKQDVMDLLTSSNGNNKISLANISAGSSSEDMFDVGSTPEKNSVESSSDFASPPVLSKLKRKSLLMDTSSTPEKQEEILLKSPEEKKKKMAPESSVDEIDFTENNVSEQSLKRRKFRDSKMSVYSLPVMEDIEEGNSSSRRASLPPNIKIIPDIKIIPSTPSPIMPDEQEWNLEAMKCSMDSSSNDKSEMIIKKPNAIDFTENKNESSSSIEIIDISSDADNAKILTQELDRNDSIVRMDTTTSEIVDLDSTPELDEVYASAKNDQERQNILKYAELMDKKDLLKL